MISAESVQNQCKVCEELQFIFDNTEAVQAAAEAA